MYTFDSIQESCGVLSSVVYDKGEQLLDSYFALKLAFLIRSSMQLTSIVISFRLDELTVMVVAIAILVLVRLEITLVVPFLPPSDLIRRRNRPKSVLLPLI